MLFRSATLFRWSSEVGERYCSKIKVELLVVLFVGEIAQELIPEKLMRAAKP
jgi:hypothetical protein